MRKIFFWVILTLSSLTLLNGCNEDSDPTSSDNNKTIYVTAINLNKSTLSLAKNEEYILTATISPTNASNKEVIWSSSSSSVATVSNGRVTALSNGTTTITAKAGTYTVTCFVTVSTAATTGSVYLKVTTPQTGYGSYSYGTLKAGIGFTAYDVQTNTFLVYKECTNKGELIIEKSNLSPGVYYYKVVLVSGGTISDSVKSGSFIITAGEKSNVTVNIIRSSH